MESLDKIECEELGELYVAVASPVNILEFIELKCLFYYAPRDSWFRHTKNTNLNKGK